MRVDWQQEEPVATPTQTDPYTQTGRETDWGQTRDTREGSPAGNTGNEGQAQPNQVTLRVWAPG